jgi:hypothetical protein
MGGVIAGQYAARQQSAVVTDDPTAQTTLNFPLTDAGTKKSPVPCFQDTGH